MQSCVLGLTSRDVPGPALPWRKRPDLGPVRARVGENNFIQVHRQQFLVLPKITKGQREAKINI